MNAGDRQEATVRCRAVLVCIVFALGLSDVMRADQAPASEKRAPAPQTRKLATNVSGTWSLIATSKGPPGMPDGVMFRATVTFKQSNVIEESKPVPLDGHFMRQDGNGGAFMGLVNGKAVIFTTVLKNPNRPGVTEFIDFVGTLDADGTIKGHVLSVSTGPGTYMRGEGPYVATRR